MPDQFEKKHALLWRAARKLLLAYGLAFAAGFGLGLILTRLVHMDPDALFQLSTKRLSYALPVFDAGARAGFDSGLLLFVWNAAGALVTISFVFTVALFDPRHLARPPRWLRKVFCGKQPMRLLCFLPGCSRIPEEAVRRAYVWLMVPLIGIALLGLENGLSASTADVIFGSFWIGLAALLPHGVIEIPTIVLAGSAAFSAHLMVKSHAGSTSSEDIFDRIERQRKDLPVAAIVAAVIVGLLLAGLIEGHVTTPLLDYLLQ